MTGKKETSGQTAVGKALRILIDLGALSCEEGVRLTDLVERTGFRKPTVHRLLSELKDYGFVEQDRATGRYRLGTKLVSLSTAVYGKTDLRRLARSHLSELVGKTGVTAHLAIRDGNEVVYIDKMEGTFPIRLASGIGWRGPLHCTALGKAILAFETEDVREDALEAELSRRTPHTITTREALAAELVRVRELGYAVDDRENEPDIRCIAAPIFNHAGEPIAAISISGTASQVSRSAFQSFGRLVRDHCLRLSRGLGFVGE